MIELFDSTLRDGEQAEEVSFSFENKIELCKLFDEFGIDYIEFGWPASNKEMIKDFRPAIEVVKKAKIVAFGSTSMTKNPEDDMNLNTIVDSGVEYACIFGKSDIEHADKQLRISLEDNLKKITDSIEFLRSKGLKVFYDAEHYFDGYTKNSGYALETLVRAIEAGAERIVLCDTNGGMMPQQAEEIVKATKKTLEQRNLEAKLGVHYHDDCDFALANTWDSLPYIVQVQGTIDGIGERVGNLNLVNFIGNYVKYYELDVKVKMLKELSDQASKLAGLKPVKRRPFVGDAAFAHKGGVHIDGISKDVSYEHCNPEMFGNKRRFVFNSLGGTAGIIQVAKSFGYEFDKKDKKFRKISQLLMKELKEMEEVGYEIGLLTAEHYLLIDKYFGKNDRIFEIKEWDLRSWKRKDTERSWFYAVCDINGEEVEGDFMVAGGPVDAAFNTLKNKILPVYYPQVKNLHLVDFRTEIAREGEEKSTVRTEIYFRDGEKFSTVGVDENIIQSSIEALEKGFRYHLLRNGYQQV